MGRVDCLARKSVYTTIAKLCEPDRIEHPVVQWHHLNVNDGASLNQIIANIL